MWWLFACVRTTVEDAGDPALADTPRGELWDAGWENVPGTYLVVASEPDVFDRFPRATVMGRSRSAPVFGVRMAFADAVALAEDPAVDSVTIDALIHTDLGADAAGCADDTAQVRPSGVDAAGKSRKGGTGAGIKVAVVDTGIDLDHPDLHVVDLVDVTGTTGGDDDNGHGTHVAGTIAALDDEIGVVGVAPDVELYGVKVLDSSGAGDYLDVAIGIDEAISLGVDVINLSISGTRDSPAVRAQVRAAKAAGIIQVAAAGNMAGPVDRSFPAAWAGDVITVSAWDVDGDRWAPFSNYGPEIDVAAGGMEICSTFPDGEWHRESGTSQAAPVVSGLVALTLELHPGSTFNEVETTIRTSVSALRSSPRHAEDLAIADDL